MIQSNKLVKIILSTALIATFANAKQLLSLVEYEKACSNNVANACYLAGYIYHEGKQTKRDLVKAQKYFEKSCKLNYTQGCKVSKMVKNNMQNMENALIKDCKNKDAEGCFGVGIFHLVGKMLPYNLEKAKEYLKKSCDLKYEKGCKIYKDITKKEK